MFDILKYVLLRTHHIDFDHLLEHECQQHHEGSYEAAFFFVFVFGGLRIQVVNAILFRTSGKDSQCPPSCLHKRQIALSFAVPKLDLYLEVCFEIQMWDEILGQVMFSNPGLLKELKGTYLGQYPQDK